MYELTAAKRAIVFDGALKHVVIESTLLSVTEKLSRNPLGRGKIGHSKSGARALIHATRMEQEFRLVMRSGFTTRHVESTMVLS